MPGTEAHARLTRIYYFGPAFDVTVGATPAVSPALVAGARYVAVARDCDVFIRQGGAGVTATPSDFRLGSRLYSRPINCDGTTDNRISVVTANGLAGTVRLMRIDGISNVRAGDPVVQEALSLVEFLGATVKRTVSNVSQAIEQLSGPGRYVLLCETDDLFVTQGTTGVVCNDNNPTLKPHFIPQGRRVVFNVDGASASNDAIAFMSATNSVGATVQVQRIDSV